MIFDKPFIKLLFIVRQINYIYQIVKVLWLYTTQVTALELTIEVYFENITSTIKIP
jgi:hypothetical protein